MKREKLVRIHTGLRVLGCLMAMCCLSISSTRAQFIQQLRLDPVQPLDNLPVKVIADLFFPSSGCPLDSVDITQPAPSRFEAYALHCVGILTVICNTSDTFDLGVLPAGNYRFVLREEYGWLPSPCTAGTQPPAIDSIDFQVTVASGLTENLQNEIVLAPNPTGDGRFTIRSSGKLTGAAFTVRDPVGRILLTQPLLSPSQPVDLSGFANGVYGVELWLDGKRVHHTRLIKHN